MNWVCKPRTSASASEAAEQRQIVAHGVSRGIICASKPKAPEGRQNRGLLCRTEFLSPRWGLSYRRRLPMARAMGYFLPALRAFRHGLGLAPIAVSIKTVHFLTP